MVSFLRRPSPRERHLFLFTIGDHHFIDELSTVVGIDPQDWKGEQCPRSLEGSQHRFLTPIQKGKTFRPSSCYVGESQGVQVAALDIHATMGHQVRFQKTGSGLLPLLEGADRDLLLQKRSRSRGGEAMLTSFALRT